MVLNSYPPIEDLWVGYKVSPNIASSVSRKILYMSVSSSEDGYSGHRPDLN